LYGGKNTKLAEEGRNGARGKNPNGTITTLYERNDMSGGLRRISHHRRRRNMPLIIGWS